MNATLPRVTAKQRAALLVYNAEGDLNEGLICDHCWRQIRNVRLVVNGLVERGLVTLGEWWDEETGYVLHVTALGQQLLDRWHDEALAAASTSQDSPR